MIAVTIDRREAAAMRAFTGRTPRALRPAWQRLLLRLFGL